MNTAMRRSTNTRGMLILVLQLCGSEQHHHQLTTARWWSSISTAVTTFRARSIVPLRWLISRPVTASVERGTPEVTLLMENISTPHTLLMQSEIQAVL